jgi:hypothetical protein
MQRRKSNGLMNYESILTEYTLGCTSSRLVSGRLPTFASLALLQSPDFQQLELDSLWMLYLFEVGERRFAARISSLSIAECSGPWLP